MKKIVSQVKQRKLPEGVREEKILDQPFSLIRSAQQIALAAILKPDVSAVYRRICRWYSKNCSTPLHLVEQIPIYDVLIAYFEERYREFSEEDLENARLELARTEAERDGTDEEQEDFYREIEAQEAAKQVDLLSVLKTKEGDAKVSEQDIKMSFKQMSAKDF